MMRASDSVVNPFRGARKKIKIVEVGMRDGLQNEKVNLSAGIRLQMADLLLSAGIQNLEIGAFVSPKWVPQMAGTAELIQALRNLRPDITDHRSEVDLTVLVPNERGMQEALKNNLTEVAVFSACSESFAKKNINCSIEESFDRFEAIFALARQRRIKVRGYLSTCFGCPYEGDVPESKVVQMAERLWKMGAYEISIGDTIGVANPRKVVSLFSKLKKKIKSSVLAGHFHDTRGLALANILAAYQMGIGVFDTSIGGLGGCPYAPGATGNVATEDVVFMFQSMGIQTGCNLAKLVEVNAWLSKQMSRPLSSKYSFAELRTRP